MSNNGDENMVEIERQRAARMAENAKRMKELFSDTDMSFMMPTPRATPTPRKRVKREANTTPAEGYRQSDRIRQLPAKPIYVVEDWTERAPKSRKPGRTGRGSTSGTCRAERGWHPALGQASDAAGDAAMNAAIERRTEMLEEGCTAYVKLMSFSQVAGGFWEQLPRGMHSHYGHVNKLRITLHCDDDRHASSFVNTVEGSSDKWSVVYLPRENNTAGLSGGWVGFAIDQKLFPNDTVIFEYMDKVNMRAHLYRAHDYETPETERYALKPQLIVTQAGQPPSNTAVAATAAGAGGAAAAAAAGENGTEASGSGSDGADAAGAADGAENVANAGGKKGSAGVGAGGGGGAAKRRRTAEARVAAGAGLVLGDMTNGEGAAGAEQQEQEGQEEEEKQQQEEENGDGDQPDVGARDQGRCGKQSRAAAGKKRAQAEAAADGAAADSVAAAAVDGAAAAGPVKKRSKAGGKDAGGTAAAAGVAGAGGAKRSRRASVKASKASRGAGAGQAAEVEGGSTELAGPDEFDEEEARCAALGTKKKWYKTAAEKRKEMEDPQFWVRKIMDTRLQGGVRQFKVRWWGFNPAWDSWEPRECLDKAPATYPWAVAMPQEVRSMK